MKALEQSLWPCWKSSLACIPMTFPHPCKTKLNGVTQQVERKGGWEAVRWDFGLPLKESMKLHISKARHGTPYPLFKPVVLLHALALVVFLTQSHAVPWVGKYLFKKIQTKMLCSARVWEDVCLRGLPGNAHQDLWVQRWCPPPYKLHRSVCILFIMLFFGFFLSVKIPF